MAFHKDFWVLAGTAAPVIALTALVAASDLLTASFRGYPKDVKPDDVKPPPLPFGLGAFWFYAISSLNFIGQGLILLFAFQSLNQESDLLPPGVVEGFEFLAFLSLLLVGFSIAARRVYQDRREARDWEAAAQASLEGKALPGRRPD